MAINSAMAYTLQVKFF